jgi:hypothetical protein
MRHKRVSGRKATLIEGGSGSCVAAKFRGLLQVFPGFIGGYLWRVWREVFVGGYIEPSFALCPYYEAVH